MGKREIGTLGEDIATAFLQKKGYAVIRRNFLFIMSTYNESENYIRSSINSILEQTLHDLELIVVIDNPENEAAVAAVNAFASEDSRVKILCNENNLGLVRSLNKAISAAHGEILARMDADDISSMTIFRTERNSGLRLLLENQVLFYGKARELQKHFLLNVC